MTMFELMYFLMTAIITSLWCAGLWAIFLPEFIFGKAGDWLEERLPAWIFKPTVGCCLCMASLHGTISFWFFLSDTNDGWIYYPLFLMVVAGGNFALMQLRRA